MEKNYLAGFGFPLTSDVISSCKGYFLALSDEKVLKKDTIIKGTGSGWIVIGSGNSKSLEAFHSLYGYDIRLWEMLTATANKVGRYSLHVIRAEIDNTGENSGELLPKFMHKEKLMKGLVNLATHFPSLEFVIYSSDIDAKS
jgi:hypothetical protein